MVTSDEERQGVSGQDDEPVAARLVAPVPEPRSDAGAEGGQPPPTDAQALSTPASESLAEPALDAEAAASTQAAFEDRPAPQTPVNAAPAAEPSVVDAPFGWLAPAAAVGAEPVTQTQQAAPPPPGVDPAADTELSEDEATGRRVESLLAETPDADPQGLQPARGRPAPPGDVGPDVAAPLTFDTPTPTFNAPPSTSFDEDDDIPPMPPTTAPFRVGMRRSGMDRVGPIVAFDFDGTLTVRDSFTAFLRWREGSARYHGEMAALAPAALKYLFDRDPGKLKAAAVRRFLQGLPRDVLNAEAMEFAAVSAPILFRPDALRAWRRYRQDGARLVIVTASPENIVAPFARGLGCDLLIATQLLFDPEDRVQGGLLGDNCRGAEKVRRIRQALGKNVVLAAAYGDTDGDWEMLEMAEQQFMRLFVGTPGQPGGPG